MRKVFEAGLPTLGSCNGMQLAASVLGGQSSASPNGREDGLARDVTLTEAGRAHPFMAGRIDGYAAPCVHRDEVSRLPDGAVVLATNNHSEVQAFAYENDGIRFWANAPGGYLLETGSKAGPVTMTTIMRPAPGRSTG